MLGTTHPSTAQASNALGNAYDVQGAYGAALACYEGALEGLEGGGGYGNVGAALRSLGRFDQALEAYEKAVEIDRKVLGPDHIDVAKGEYGQAMALDRMGKFDQALALYSDVLRIQWSCGGERQAIASTLNNVGVVLERQGRHEEALLKLAQALEMRIKELGGDHVDVAATLFNIAISRSAMGDAEGAMKACLESLGICEGALGEAHERTRARREMAGWLEAGGWPAPV